MTTNQTIDGVPRRMLTALLCHVSELENRALVDELRTLLNREVITDDHLRQRIAFLTSEVHARANERDAAIRELAELKAVQPQGEPVPDERALYDAWRESNLGYVRPFNKYEWSAWEARARLAEQPAPVAVVLPDRLSWSGIAPAHIRNHVKGWNACLDELKRINPSL